MSRIALNKLTRVIKIGKLINPDTASGESIGIEKISAITGPLLFAELIKMMENKAHAQDYYEAAYERLVDQGTPFHALDITGLDWTEIDTAEDFSVANTMFKSPVITVSRN